MWQKRQKSEWTEGVAVSGTVGPPQRGYKGYPSQVVPAGEPRSTQKEKRTNRRRRWRQRRKLSSHCMQRTSGQLSDYSTRQYPCPIHYH